MEEITENSGLKIFQILKEFKEDSSKIDGWFSRFCEEKFKEIPEKILPSEAYSVIGYKTTSIYSDRKKWKYKEFITKEEIVDRYIESRGQKNMPYEFDNIADSYILKYVPLFGASTCGRYLGLTAKISLNRFKELSGNNKTTRLENDIRNSFTSLLSNNDSYEEAARFIDIKMPEVAYILGLIWADGYLQIKQRSSGTKTAIINIGLVSEDFVEIKPTLDKIGNWGVSYRDNTVYRWKHSSTARLSNKILGLFLAEFGYTSKSSGSADAILKRIPENLLKYWFRGLFDGDGSYIFYGYRIVIASSYDQDWSYMETICKKLNIKNFCFRQSISKKGHKSSIFEISSLEDSLKFLDFIYDGRREDNIGLSRKYLSYLDFKDNIEGIINLNKFQLEVRRWMKRASQDTPNRPTIPTPQVAELRCKLIQEELDELITAMGWDGQNFDTTKCNLVECYDALLDLIYVVFGGFVALGLNFEPGWKEVCKSNNSKFAPGFSFREDGKLLKSPLYIPALLKPIVDQQIENGQYYSKNKNKKIKDYKGEF